MSTTAVARSTADSSIFLWLRRQRNQPKFLHTHSVVLGSDDDSFRQKITADSPITSICDAIYACSLEGALCSFAAFTAHKKGFAALGDFFRGEFRGTVDEFFGSSYFVELLRDPPSLCHKHVFAYVSPRR